MEHKKFSYEIDFLQLLRTLWKRAWVILCAVAAAGLIGWLYSTFLATPMYTAETLMYVDNHSESSTSISSGDLSAAQSLVDTYGVILTARSTMKTVLENSGMNYTVEELQEMVKSKSVNGTEVFSVTVTCDDPQKAAALANAIAAILPDKLSDVIQGSSVSVVDSADVPEKPSSPNIMKNIAIGVLLGLLLASGGVVIQFLLDTKIHDEEYLLRMYQLPILAAVPDLNQKSSKAGYYEAPVMHGKGRRAKQK